MLEAAALGAGGCDPFSTLWHTRGPLPCLSPPQVAEAKYDFFENEWKNISDDAKDIIRRLAPE